MPWRRLSLRRLEQRMPMDFGFWSLSAQVRRIPNLAADDSTVELRQARNARRLHSIERRLPFLFVGTASVEWTDSSGRLRPSNEPGDRVVRRLSIERPIERSWRGFRSAGFRGVMALLVLVWGAVLARATTGVQVRAS